MQHIEINPDFEPEVICEIYGIDLKEFLNLIQGNRMLEFTKNAADIIDEYKKKIAKDLEQKRKSEATLYYYNYFLDRFKVFLTSKNPDFSLLDLTEDLMDDFFALSSTEEFQLSEGAKNTYQAIVNSIIYFAFKNKYISEDIRDRFEMYKQEKMPRYIPSNVIKELLKMALKTSSPFFDYTVLYFLVGTGCRLHELVNVRICDFKVEENVIFIRKGKGDKERYIPMYPEVKRVVMDFLSRTGVKSIKYNDERHLFSKRIYDNRKPVLERSIQQLIEKLLKRIGIYNQYSVHSFRHSFAVQSIKQGMPYHILQQVLGHGSIETTTIYTKLHPQDLKDEVVGKYPFPFEKLLKHMAGFGG
jgi:site-specific recombinase XerD